MFKHTTHTPVLSSSVPMPRGNTMYAAYAIRGNDGQYYPARCYPAFLLGICSEFDVEALLLVENALIGFASYDEAKSFASWGARSDASLSLGLLSPNVVASTDSTMEVA